MKTSKVENVKKGNVYQRSEHVFEVVAQWFESSCNEKMLNSYIINRGSNPKLGRSSTYELGSDFK
jgi:hypothetical protein